MKRNQRFSNSVQSYYRKTESRFGYRLLLGGTRHFGYYPHGARLGHRDAILRMEAQLERRLALEGSSQTILDAGCGEGHVAARLLERHPSLSVIGIDLLPENVQIAREVAEAMHVTDRLSLHEGSYDRLPLEDGSVDAIYTMETLVHAPDYEAALAEFFRVLRKGGRYVAFEYTLRPLHKMPSSAAQVFQRIIEGSAMHSFGHFYEGEFGNVLQKAGFTDVVVDDLSHHIEPMLKWFHDLGVIPYELSRRISMDHKFVNAMSGVELYRHRLLWQYVAAMCVKP